MKKFFLTLAMLCMFFSYSVQASNVKPPEVSADGAILMDANSGQILYSKNIDTAYPPASTTKIMTALLTLENCKLTDLVTIGKNPPLADGSKIYIYEGETLTVEQLLHGLLLCSANDCAEALAEHIGGSIDDFAEMMNKRAKELGCTNTNFVNPSGLYNEKHKTSAKDLALIMKELVKHQEYVNIAKTNIYKIPATNKCKDERPLWNENRLIQPYSKFYYSFCEGGKTGYTVQSLHSYVASASKDNHRLVVALIHDGHKTFFKDAPELFKYGFENFELLKLYSKGDVLSTYEINKDTKIPIIINDDFYYTLAKDEPKEIKCDVKLNVDDLQDKAFKKGDLLGKASIIYDENSIGTVEVSSGSNYEPKKILGVSMTTSNKTKGNAFLKTIKYIAILVLSIFLFLLFIRILKKRRRRRKSNKLK